MIFLRNDCDIVALLLVLFLCSHYYVRSLKNTIASPMVIREQAELQTALREQHSGRRFQDLVSMLS
jgi:hypothetical protein